MSQVNKSSVEQAIVLAEAAGRLAVNFSNANSPQAQKLCARLLDMANDLVSPQEQKAAQPQEPVITCEQLANAIATGFYSSIDNPRHIAEAIFHYIHPTPPFGR